MNHLKKHGLFSTPSKWKDHLRDYGFVVLWFWWIYMVFASSTFDPYRALVKSVLRQVPQPFDKLLWMLVATAVAGAPLFGLWFIAFCSLKLSTRRLRISAATEHAARDKEHLALEKRLNEILTEARGNAALTEKELAEIQKSIQDMQAEHRDIESRMTRYRENPQALEAELRLQKAKYEASLQTKKPEK